jgi:hypothetical protein
MKLYVPEIGDKLKLTNDWTFDLHWEHRNTGLIKHFFGEDFKWGRDNVAPRPVTLLAGTVITVDRIYIRQGASEYSSISFYAAIGETGKGSFGKPKSPRFWATLKDCNKIEFEVEKSAPNLKLTYDYNVRDIKNGDYAYGYMNNVERPKTDLIHVVILDFLTTSFEGNCFKVISARNLQPVLKVKLDVEIEWKETEYTQRNILGLSTTRKTWESHYKNPKYTLFTLEGEEIGNWKSLASLKKNAKEYVALHNL